MQSSIRKFREVFVCVVFPMVCILFFCTGCSTFWRGAATTAAAGAGAVAGGGLGFLANPTNPMAAVGGAAIGGASSALLTSAALGEDESVKRKGYEDGYISGQADEVKRLYWAKQRLEQQGDGGSNRQYYTFPGRTELADGTQLVPHDVTVMIDE